jgi:hypothetical protein
MAIVQITEKAKAFLEIVPLQGPKQLSGRPDDQGGLFFLLEPSELGDAGAAVSAAELATRSLDDLAEIVTITLSLAWIQKVIRRYREQEGQG